DLLEQAARNAHGRTVGQAVEHSLQGNAAPLRYRLQDPVRLLREILPDQVLDRVYALYGHGAHSAACATGPMVWKTSKPSNSGWLRVSGLPGLTLARLWEARNCSERVQASKFSREPQTVWDE